LLGCPLRRTVSLIDEECRKLIQAFIDDQDGILDSNNQFYLQYKGRIRQIKNSLKKREFFPCSSQTLQSIKELASCPELIEAQAAMQKRIYPKLISEGISGSYIIRDRRSNPIAIFKARDEEPGMAGNPKNFGNLCKYDLEYTFGIPAGTSYLRERVAYLLDKKDHFSGVPLTKITQFSSCHFKSHKLGKQFVEGSFQKWIPQSHHAKEDHGFFKGLLGGSIPKAEIHKIAVLDIRTLNCDRHLLNFLVNDKLEKAYPIDHGYILPGKADSIRFDWIDFPQAKKKFSEETLSHIANLDVEKDIMLIRKVIPGISQQSLDMFRVSTLLLQIAARNGFTAYHIADLMLGEKHRKGLFDAINKFIPIFNQKTTASSSRFQTEIYPCVRQKSSSQIPSILEAIVLSYKEKHKIGSESLLKRTTNLFSRKK
jgi:hypothetical protein